MIASCQSPSPEGWNGKRAAVALTYDDGLHVHLDNVVSLLDSLEMKGTFYLPGYTGCLQERMPEWRSIAENGHELGNHTLYHPCAGKSKRRLWVKKDYDLDNYSEKRLIDEIRTASILLSAVDNQLSRTFAYTCGDTEVQGKSFKKTIAKDFIAARGVQEGLNYKKTIDMSEIKTYAVNGQSASELIALVEEAIQNQAFITFLFHGVGGEHDLNISEATHRKLVQHIKKRENEIWVATMLDIGIFLTENK